MRRLVMEVFSEARGRDYCGMRIISDEDDDRVMAEYDALVAQLKRRNEQRMADLDREIRAGAQARSERRMRRKNAR
jgi:hypothetical protein